MPPLAAALRQRAANRRPPGDGPRTAPCVGVVHDPREESPQRDHGAQLAFFLIGPADGGSSGLINAEHAKSMSVVAAPGKQTRSLSASPMSGVTDPHRCLSPLPFVLWSAEQLLGDVV